jgi:hypothetical protein
MGTLFADVPPPKKPNRKRSVLFGHLKECNTEIENADKIILADFITLQSVWRQQSNHHRTLRREERQAWGLLIQHLAGLPPPRN